jgi:coiled-coil domain-containing protein 130
MQGFNMGRYVPPDLEGTTSGNKLNKKHPLGNRASKLASQGILTVRFEMPFPIWCAHCPKPTIIGQGVRFNAEKKRAGNYYTTPIWSFRFRHVECGGWIEMRTDPKNTAYVVAEGATKRDTGEDKVLPGEEQAVIMTDEEREALRKNAFASLEKTIADRERLKMATERIDDLEDLSKKHWDDPYAQNQRLRKAFRVGRKEREKMATATEDLKDRMGLGIDLLPEREEDAKRAALVDFGSKGREEEESDGGKALSKPLFANPPPSLSAITTKTNTKKMTQKHSSSSSFTKVTRLKAEKEASRRKETFVAEFISNTRAAQDPFLVQGSNGGEKATNRVSLGIIKKRKRMESEAGGDERDGSVPETKATTPVPASALGLVQYDSD